MPVTPSLDLDVLAPARQSARIRSSAHPDGKFYELRYQSELSMLDIATLGSLTKQIEPLVSDPNALPTNEAQLLDEWLDSALTIIFHTTLEAEVLGEMGCMHKWRVLQFFGEVCTAQGQPQQTSSTRSRKTPTGVQ